MSPKVDHAAFDAKRKLVQLEKRLVALEAEVAELKTLLDPERKQRLLKTLDEIEEEIEEEVGAQSKEVEREAKKWVEDEKRFLGIDEEEKAPAQKPEPADKKPGAAAKR